MTRHRPPRLALLLTRLLPDEDAPLVGDLIEAQGDRPKGWFWRQVLFAVLRRRIGRARAWHHQAVAAGLVAMAMLAVLGFEVVVAASLLDHVFEEIGLADAPWATVQPHWLASLTALSFISAVVVGRIAARVHQRSRVVVVLACGVSATAMALVTIYLLNPAPMRPFLPSAALQVAAAIVFIIGLFVGFASNLVRERPVESPLLGARPSNRNDRHHFPAN